MESTEGPGTELHAILQSIDIHPDLDCDCEIRIARMNSWGVEGCLRNFDTIVSWIRDKERKWRLDKKVSAGIKLLRSDPLLALSLDLTDPAPGLVLAAIERTRNLPSNELSS